MITLGLVLKIFLFIYLSVAFIVFINFIIRPYNMTITNNMTNKKEEIYGFKKVKWLFLFSLLWPITIHFSKGE